MFKIGDKVVYKRKVCVIKDITLNKFTDKECYILIPIDDDSLKITVFSTFFSSGIIKIL